MCISRREIKKPLYSDKRLNPVGKQNNDHTHVREPWQKLEKEQQIGGRVQDGSFEWTNPPERNPIKSEQTGARRRLLTQHCPRPLLCTAEGTRSQTQPFWNANSAQGQLTGREPRNRPMTHFARETGLKNSKGKWTIHQQAKTKLQQPWRLWVQQSLVEREVSSNSYLHWGKVSRELPRFMHQLKQHTVPKANRRKEIIEVGAENIKWKIGGGRNQQN